MIVAVFTELEAVFIELMYVFCTTSYSLHLKLQRGSDRNLLSVLSDDVELHF